MSKYRCEFFPRENLCVTTTNDDRLDLADIVMWFCENVIENEAHITGVKYLFDFRSLSGVENFNYMTAKTSGEKYRQKCLPKIGNNRRVLVASNDLVFGEFRMWTMIMQATEKARICRNMEDAFDWLGVDDPGLIG